MESEIVDTKVTKEILEPELMNMKDCKSVADFSFDKVEMVRGATPQDINEKCLTLCQDYLAGIWTKQTVETITVKRLSGGLTNQMYYCALNDNVNNNSSATDGVPHEVAIRLYGPKHTDKENRSYERLSDTIVDLMISENKLGPKVYGVFEEGQILHYYKHRHFRIKEQNNSQLAEQLFRKMARVHAMDVPIKKNNLLFEYFDTMYEKSNKSSQIIQMINDLNLVTLKKYDIKREIAWLKQAVIKINSPLVFSHVDLTGANIMVTEPNDEIILCDFEYSCYGFRGLDLGTLLGEWGLKDLFKPENQLENYPNDEKIRSLLRPYFEESVQIFGKKYSENENNSLNQLVIETKLFSMVYDFFCLMFALRTCSDDNEQDQHENVFDKKIIMELAEINYKAYMKMKNKYIQDKIID